MSFENKPFSNLKEPILVIDDESDIIDYIIDLAETLGLKTVSTTNPTSASKLLEESSPFMVICDFNMPEMNGIDLCKALKAIRPATPFVLFTAYADRNTAMASVRVAVDEILEKPCKDETIIEAMSKYANLRLKVIAEESEETENLCNIFLEEANELFADLDSLILRLEDLTLDKAIVDLLFRKIHTVKGGTGAVPYAKELAGVCHEFESSLSLIKDGTMVQGPHIINTYLNVAELCHELLVCIKMRVLPDLNLKAKAELARQQLRGLQDIKQEVRDKPSPVAATHARTELKGHEEEGLWVSNESLDQLVSMLGDFVVLKNQVELLIRDQKLFADPYRSQKKLKEISVRTSKIADRLQANVMATRKIKLDKALSMLSRIARQVSHDVNKNVTFTMKGLDFGVDKATGKIVAGALTHLLRNSIDHGIEAPHERVASGKAPAGTIEVLASEYAGHVHIVLKDDGKGINPAFIAKKAVEKGIISAERAATFSAQESYEMLFMPSFSTADKVSSISGRGVGMDAVRSSLAEIHGTITISSEIGKGTSFELSIPVPRSIAVEKTILIQTEDILVAIPLDNIVAFIARNDLLISEVDGCDLCLFQDQNVPLYDYYSLAGITPPERSQGFIYAVFIKYNDAMIALKAKAILGHLDAVVRPFDEVIKSLPAFKGTTVLGNEKVAYIISPEQCLNLGRKLKAA